MSEMSVSLSRSRTAFDHCCRLSRATRGVATSTAAGGDDGIAYGSPPRPVLPWPAVPGPASARLPAARARAR